MQRGDRRGRELGYPTANLGLGDYQRPGYGIYAVRVTLDDGSEHPGVASLGVRPTFEPPRICSRRICSGSTAIFTAGEIEVALHAYIREEKKFDDVAALGRPDAGRRGRGEKASRFARCLTKSFHAKFAQRREKRVQWFSGGRGGAEVSLLTSSSHPRKRGSACLAGQETTGRSRLKAGMTVVSASQREIFPFSASASPRLRVNPPFLAICEGFAFLRGAPR